MAVLETTRPFEYLKAALVDAFTTHSTIKAPDNLVIVEISEDDYKNLFDAQSPLKPNGVFELIKAAKALNPSVIGVDLDTSEPQWACGDANDYATFAKDPNVLWAEVPRQKHDREPDTEDQSSSITVAPILGGRLSDVAQMGLVRFPQDVDGYVRAFRSSYEVDGPLRHYNADAELSCEKSRDGLVPAHDPDQTTHLASPEMRAFFQMLAEAHARAHNPGNPKVAPASKEMQYLRFRESRYNFRIVDAGYLVTRDAQGRFKPRPLDAKQIDRLSHPIVLIGGAYPEARDQYYTPLGPMLGVELIANAVEVQLGKSTKVVSGRETAAWDGVAGFVIIMIYFCCPTRPVLAFLLSLVAMGLAVGFATLRYSIGAAFLNLVPVMAGMVIHQMIEGTGQALKLTEHVKKKDRRILELEKALESAGIHPETQADAGSAAPAGGETVPADVLPKPPQPEIPADDQTQPKAQATALGKS